MKQCCTDHNGEQKEKYKTQEDAENAAERRRREGVTVNVYRCEEEDGWHLTSQNAPPLERPIRVMSKEERKLYTKQNKNRMGSMFDPELIAQMQSDVRNNTLSILRNRIEPLQHVFDEKRRDYALVRKQYVLAAKRNEDLETLGKKLLIAEQELKTARIKLRAAKHEYEAATRRIT